MQPKTIPSYNKSMPTLSADTNPKAEQVQIELLRRTPAWRKIQMVAELNETIKTLALNGLRQRNPNASEEQLRRMLADLLLGETLAAQVYGPITKESDQNQEYDFHHANSNQNPRQDHPAPQMARSKSHQGW